MSSDDDQLPFADADTASAPDLTAAFTPSPFTTDQLQGVWDPGQLTGDQVSAGLGSDHWASDPTHAPLTPDLLTTNQLQAAWSPDQLTGDHVAAISSAPWAAPPPDAMVTMDPPTTAQPHGAWTSDHSAIEPAHGTLDGDLHTTDQLQVAWNPDQFGSAPVFAAFSSDQGAPDQPLYAMLNPDLFPVDQAHSAAPLNDQPAGAQSQPATHPGEEQPATGGPALGPAFRPSGEYQLRIDPRFQSPWLAHGVPPPRLDLPASLPVDLTPSSHLWANNPGAVPLDFWSQTAKDLYDRASKVSAGWGLTAGEPLPFATPIRSPGSASDFDPLGVIVGPVYRPKR
jgi:hypothetical protein